MSAVETLKTLSRTSGLLLALLLSVCILRAVFLFPSPKEDEQCGTSASHKRIDETTRPGIVDRFSQALRFRTITRATKQYDADQLLQLTAFLRKGER